MNNSEISHNCKHCHTTNPLHFYKSNTKTCKICKVPENRAQGITSITKLYQSTFVCKQCNIPKSKDNFDISVSGYYHEKCRDCKSAHAAKISQEEKSKNVVIIPINKDPSILNTSFLSIPQDRYVYLKNYLDTILPYFNKDELKIFTALCIEKTLK